MSRTPLRAINQIVMQTIGILMLVPLILMFFTSMKPEAEVLNPEASAERA
jgi:ABC-type glycerol-3-phosphate transport system permease component